MSAAEADQRPAASPVALSPEEFPWEPLEVDGEAEVRTVIGAGLSDTLGAGLARFRDTSFEWNLDYDEVLYVLDGEVEIEHHGGTARGARGDVLLVPRGSRVTYHFRGECIVFFATYPVDWAERAGD